MTKYQNKEVPEIVLAVACRAREIYYAGALKTTPEPWEGLAEQERHAWIPYAMAAYEASGIAQRPDVTMLPISIEIAQSVANDFKGFEDSAGLDFIKSDTDVECDLTIGDIRAALDAARTAKGKKP